MFVAQHLPDTASRWAPPCYTQRMKTQTDPRQIEEFLTRSVAAIYPSPDALRERLLSGERLTAYVGIDPTSTYVHLGHSTNYLLLERLHKLGHRIVVLVGDFTAMIGDPDKGAARTRLTADEVRANLATFKEQIGKVLPFDDAENPIEFKFNSAWLKELGFADIVDIASSFTVQHMIERDLFERRIKEQKPLYLHEFLYPLMQGYDSVAMSVDLEIGGTDQTFNMLAGRTLVRRMQDREKLVLATTLLENPVTGEQLMSKSKGTGISLGSDANDMFGKTMALPDEAIIQVFVDCTRVPLDEIDAKRARLDAGENPKDLKLELALEIVRMYHGKDAAADAMTSWIAAFSQKGIPENIPAYPVTPGMTILDAIVHHGLVSSRTEARRLFEQGAVTDLSSGEKISDPSMPLSASLTTKIGKHRFATFTI